MRLMYLCSALLLLILLPTTCQGGNILVFPAEGSHWVNMDILLQALHSRGHNITIVRPSNTWFIKDNSTYYSSYTVPVKTGTDKDFVTRVISEIIAFEREALPLTSFLGTTIGMVGALIEVHKGVCEFVTVMLDDRELMRKLKDTKFDMVLGDPWYGSGPILAKYLNLPLVYNVRWLFAGEGHFFIAPSPTSYVPLRGSGCTDKMSFFQRVKNMIVHLLTEPQNYLIKEKYQEVCDKYLGPNHDFNQVMTDADIWLMRTDFVFDYPRPTMPNVVYMGGFQCKPAKPLPKHLEDFVQSSGDHGVVIMSLGTFVTELPADIANEIAAAFAKLPQKVIWRYKGSRPDTLGNNTLLVDWMPQNDLLGHPKVKVFVAHGGTNGVQEALYHGVPVVGIPLFYDQYDNLLRLEDRGGAKILTLATVDKDKNFLKALQQLLNEPSYRMNMQRLSRLHRDQPITPMDNALFWIEFVMRHKGAAHLKSASRTMPWYSYHSVDVALFLGGAVLLVFLTIFFLIRCLCRAMCKSKVKRE